METKHKSAKVMLSLLVLAGLAVFSLFAVGGSLEPTAPPGPTMKTLNEVEPRIAIHASDLPLTITEPNSYYLAEDISFASTANHAITIECNDVTIDLMGYTLKGPDSGSKSGIYMNARTNVEIRNGTVRDFYRGVYESSSFGRQHRVINVRLMSNEYYGIRLSGYGNLVKDCTAAENSTYGIYAGYGSTVTGNTAYDNVSSGISAASGCTVTGNTTHNNGGAGISGGDGSTVTGNTARYNTGNGIIASDGCTVTGNTTAYNTLDGIKVTYACHVVDNTCMVNGNNGDGAGIHATGNGNHIERNTVTLSDRGIDVDSSPNLIVKNAASGNGTEYSIVGGNKIGAISADPTTAGPWDNFDF